MATLKKLDKIIVINENGLLPEYDIDWETKTEIDIPNYSIQVQKAVNIPLYSIRIKRNMVPSNDYLVTFPCAIPYCVFIHQDNVPEVSEHTNLAVVKTEYLHKHNGTVIAEQDDWTYITTFTYITYKHNGKLYKYTKIGDDWISDEISTIHHLRTLEAFLDRILNLFGIDKYKEEEG